jgi:hypothetical protein
LSTALDYKDRRYDVLAFRGAVQRGDVELVQSFFDEESSGEICTGMQKLSQRWALEFLTERGSMQFLPLRGCQFMTSLRQGRLRSEADVQTAFDFSLLDIRRNLVNEESDDMADDERYASAELLSISILAGFLHLSVGIYSLAGNSRKVILPISTIA